MILIRFQLATVFLSDVFDARHSLQVARQILQLKVCLTVVKWNHRHSILALECVAIGCLGYSVAYIVYEEHLVQLSVDHP